jgi:hypothetical protein
VGPNAAALKLAKKYDPEGHRALGVVTKVNYVLEYRLITQ